MKPVRVILLGTAKETYEGLLREQNSRDASLLRSITQKIAFIKQDPFHGDNIKKQLIPPSLDATNLWRVELCNYWRLLHTIRGDETTTVCFVLRILDHRDYDALFGYRKR